MHAFYIFSPVPLAFSWLCWSFHFLYRSLLVWCNLIYFCFCNVWFCIASKKTIAKNNVKKVFCYSIIYFELIFVYSVILHVYIQFSQHHLLKRLSFPHCVLLLPLSKTIKYRHIDLFLNSQFWSICLFWWYYQIFLITIL